MKWLFVVRYPTQTNGTKTTSSWAHHWPIRIATRTLLANTFACDAGQFIAASAFVAPAGASLLDGRCMYLATATVDVPFVEDCVS